jgi:hypothetical protein
MTAVASSSRYVDLDATRHLTAGLTFDLVRCVPVLDQALVSLNEQTGIPDQLTDWIRAGAFDAGPCPYDGRGRIIVDVTQTVSGKGQHGYFATVLRKRDERETTPVVFFSMHSPTLDIPMRVEIPLRALLLGNPLLAGTYTLYLHALLTNQGSSFVYYGITKRGWSLRFNEHTRAAVAQKSKRLLASTLNDLIEARAAELHGTVDDRPKLAGLVSAVCGVGMTRDAALEAEERMVDKYSLASKHPYGLNMIPGGLAGLKQARHLLRGR